MVEQLRQDFPAWDVNEEVRHGSPAGQILEFAETWKPDLIVEILCLRQQLSSGSV